MQCSGSAAPAEPAREGNTVRSDFLTVAAKSTHELNIPLGDSRCGDGALPRHGGGDGVFKSTLSSLIPNRAHT